MSTIPATHSVASGLLALAVSLSLCPAAIADVQCLAASVERQHSPNTLADVAGLFGNPPDKDPIEPFTLYGTNFKKYVIEVLDGEKVVSRKRGFTVDACVTGLAASQETPQFQGLPTGEKVRAAGNITCRKAESVDMKEACSTACQSSCSLAIDRYLQENQERSGYVMDESDKKRLLKSCSRDCTYECTKPGRAFDFVIPFRKYSAAAFP